MPISIWSSSVRKQNCHLVQSLRSMLPKSKYRIEIHYVSWWTSLLSVNEIWKFKRIINKKHRGVVTNDIIITLLGIEFHGESSWISYRIGCSSFSSNSWKSKENRSLPSNFVKEVCFCIFRNILIYFEFTKRSRSFSMNNSFWNSFSVEVSKLVN